jgi:AcrR family transcriptional regulator
MIERGGVAKAMLYDTFGSEDALIRAYLEARHDAREARPRAWLERYDGPCESAPTSGVRSACDAARGWMRGWMRELFARFARDAGVASHRADALAVQWSTLYDGTSVMGQIEGSPHAAMAARDAAAVLLDQARSARKAAKPRRA